MPVFSDSSQKLAVMSIGFLLKNKDDAVVWRGPKKNGMACVKSYGWGDQEDLGFSCVYYCDYPF